MPRAKNEPASTSTEVAVASKKPGLLEVFGQRYDIDPSRVRDTLLAGAFKGVKADHELISLLVIANQYELNPFAKEMGGFAKDGVVHPMVFKDGWLRILLRQPTYRGKVYREAEDRIKMDGSKPCPEWVECQISFNNGRDPETARVYLAEWFRNTPTWKQMPYQMLKGKAMKEAVREAFGINLMDEDDRDRMLYDDPAATVAPRASSNAAKARAALGLTPEPPAAPEAAEEPDEVEDAVIVDEVTGEVAPAEPIDAVTDPDQGELV